MFRNVGLLVILAILPRPGLVQDLLQGIDPDVRAGLVFEGIRIDRRISRDVPSVLADFMPPIGFEFVGSSIDDVRWVAVYKTGITSDTAKQQAGMAMMEAGWQTYRPWMSGGFVNVHMPDVTLCRDDQIVYVSALSIDGGSYVFVKSANDYTNCSGEIVRPAIPDILLRPTSRYLPRLELPSGAVMVEMEPDFTGAGSNAIEASMRIRLSLDPDLGSKHLAEEYSAQLTSQDWVIQGDWAADGAAGSSWLAVRDDNVLLSGLLQVVTLGNSEYHVVFHLDHIF